MVIHLSCSSFRVSVKRVSPALALAMIPALETRESVRVDLPWSTCAMTDMLRMFRFLSIITRISSTVKFTWTKQIPLDIFVPNSRSLNRWEALLSHARCIFKAFVSFAPGVLSLHHHNLLNNNVFHNTKITGTHWKRHPITKENVGENLLSTLFKY